MSANLRLIESCVHTVPFFGANPSQASPPRVLTTAFRQRLADANHAARQLRALGLQVRGVMLTAAHHERVEIRIERPGDLRPLLDAARPERPWWANDRVRNMGHVIFCSVLVSWREL